MEPAEPPEPTAAPRAHAPGDPRGRYLAALALSALGVVYGDIGTSVLYAVEESFHHTHGIDPTRANVLGVLSLIVWALVFVISIKYAVFVLRADNRGEGGILALTALVTPVGALRRNGRGVLILLGLFGTALLYGDGMITPVMSILSAVEGLEVATPAFEPFIVPITIAILVVLFAVQRHGTAGVGRIFGPVTLLWFAMIAVMGVAQIVRAPEVLAALNPLHGIGFFGRNGWSGFLVLGSVFLVVTGGEAMYADLGHFGRRPIRAAWFTVVLPALLLNYFGQGALLLRDPDAVGNPFFHMAPAWALYPVVVIATLAAIIASQALITGAFSLTMQAVQLGYVPRVRIDHTSSRERGQIYIPAVNWLLLAACVGLVLGFRRSTNVAAAYGVAVTTTMVITTLLLFVVERERWRWPLWATVLFTGGFLAVDLAFWGANMAKIAHGGWFPLAIGAVMFAAFTTWKTGRRILADRLAAGTLPMDTFVANVAANPPDRVPGTAVFMFSNPNGTPPALLHSLKHYKVLHEQTVLLSVLTEEVPHVPAEERVEVEALGHGLFRVCLHYGFMEEPSVPEALAGVRAEGLDLAPMRTSYFLGRETLIPSRERRMARWRLRLFALRSRNARPATAFYGLPPNRVVELGAQIQL
ncbi:MAG TPA: potassium transporter Kup [Longimicrobium sp.]|nr:potassium transporter Kup [Longimicrobium sp.]